MDRDGSELLINNSEEYLFEVKTTNFKIILNKLVETLENLETDDENYENDMYNIIIIGEELIKQFDFIQKRMLDYHDKKSPTNIRNMEKKIEKLIKEVEAGKIALDILNSILTTEKEKCVNLSKENTTRIEKLIKEVEDGRIALDTLNKLFTNEKKICDNLNKENEENKIKVKECNKTVQELENLLGNQGLEIFKLHLEINNTKDIDHNEQTILTDNISQKSPEYLSKLNEGNIKVIKQKNEKIKTLQFEISDMYIKLNTLTEINNELENKIKNCIGKLSELNIMKENEVNDTICKYNGEINILNSRIHNLEDENYNLKLHKDVNNNDVKIPLLERQDTIFYEHFTEKQKCNFCSIL